MSDDPREAQSKSDKPAASTGLDRHVPASSAVPAASVRVASAVPASSAVRPPDASDADDEFDDDDEDFPETVTERLLRIQPAPVILTAGSLASLVFLTVAMTSHTTPVPVLTGAAVIAGLIFGVDAIVASLATWRASKEGRVGWAFFLAMIGGIATLVSAGAFAGTLIIVLLLNS